MSNVYRFPGGSGGPSPLSFCPEGEREEAPKLDRPGPRFRGDDRGYGAAYHPVGYRKAGGPAYECPGCGLYFSAPNALHVCERGQPGPRFHGDDKWRGMFWWLAYVAFVILTSAAAYDHALSRTERHDQERIVSIAQGGRK